MSARAGAPEVVDRRRAELIGAGLPSQPYHHEALELDLREAEALVRRVRRSVAGHSMAALTQLRDALAPARRLAGISIREGPTPPVPDALAEVLESRRATFAADGEMYRRALCEAAAGLGLDVTLQDRRSPIASAAAALHADEEQARRLLAELGRELGPPWRKDERAAAASAIAALGARTRLVRAP